MKKQEILKLIQSYILLGPPVDEQIVIPASLLHKTLAAMISDAFQDEWYVDKYPDVGQAVDSGIVGSALMHFVESGMYEKRLPFDLDLDVDAYIRNHPDVQDGIKDGYFASAQAHFEQVGLYEGRSFALAAPAPDEMTDD